MIKTDKELMDVDTFLEIYGITRSMYFSHKKKGLLKTVSIGRRTFVKRTHAEEWLMKIGEKN